MESRLLVLASRAMLFAKVNYSQLAEKSSRRMFQLGRRTERGGFIQSLQKIKRSMDTKWLVLVHGHMDLSQ